jgi:hypothetical protein
MLNLCVFIFILYAVSYSVKEILFPNWGKKTQKAVSHSRTRNTNKQKSANICRNYSYRQKTTTVRASANNRKSTQPKKIYNIKTGRLVNPKRPVVLSSEIFYNPRTFVAIAK